MWKNRVLLSLVFCSIFNKGALAQQQCEYMDIADINGAIKKQYACLNVNGVWEFRNSPRQIIAPKLESNSTASTNFPEKRISDAVYVRTAKSLARNGNADVQLHLGIMYITGDRVPQDYSEAARWIRLAAQQGNAKAQYNLGVMYSRGQGVNQDQVEAVRLYQLSAQQGNVDAQYNLGLAYGKGKGVTRNLAEAVRWHRLGAQQGDANNQAMLGFFYILGKGVRKDVIEGKRLIRLAAKKGNVEAQNTLRQLGEKW